jgi:hypothetical protein
MRKRKREVNAYTCNMAPVTWVMIDKGCIARTRTHRLGTSIDKLSLTSYDFVRGRDGAAARIGGQINL